MKYIVVTGGVISGIGKGITSSSIAILFKEMGFVVTMIKIDPYLNIDAGTMSPFEHGECFVLEDGGECDLDLGNYERFLNINLTRNHNITTGRIYQRVISKERNGDYLGSTVQVVPHITDEIMLQIRTASVIPINGKIPQICVIEVGGTIGDIEGLPFIEALQQMRLNPDDSFCYVHVAMAINNPDPKTKPIQHSISTLRSRGIFPDLLVVRWHDNDLMPKEIKEKLHRMCQIATEDIITNPDVDSIYSVPGVFNQQDICARISSPLKISPVERRTDPFLSILSRLGGKWKIKIGIVGKYTNLSVGKAPDTYLSLVRAIEHAGFSLNVNPEICWIDSENVKESELGNYDCFIIPGGFGSRGIPGKLLVTKYARENNVPILGICLGMQIMVVDCFNNLSGNIGCSSEWKEIISDPDPHYVVDILPDQTGVKGGTMRLGSYETTLYKSKVMDLYRSSTITERHRHRYEVNNECVDILEIYGLKFVGTSRGSNGNELMEICELDDHPFYIGCQFHPEYKSRVEVPHPLFVGLLSAAQKQ